MKLNNIKVIQAVRIARFDFAAVAPWQAQSTLSFDTYPLIPLFAPSSTSI